MNNPPPDYAPKLLEALRHVSIDKLIVGLFYLTLIAVPLSISRIWITGWQPVYAVHIICLLLVTSVFFSRQTLSYLTKSNIVCSLSSIVAMSALLNFGLISNGILWCTITLFLSQFFTNKRTTLFFATLLSITYFIAMYLFVVTKKALPVDPNVYLSTYIAWAVGFFGAALFFALFVSIIEMKRRQITELLLMFENQNIKIDEQSKLIEHQANHDILTGLPTLRLLDDRLQMALNLAKRTKTNVAVLFMDLDGFKSINDTYGHQTGDFVLKTVSKILSDSVRGPDSVCRAGGDEFIAVIGQFSNEEHIITICERIINDVSLPIEYKQLKLNVGISIGAAIYPHSGKTAKDLISAADKLMYRVKESGKNNFLISRV